MTAFDLPPLILALALALDRIVGDPPWLWRRVRHPVVAIGYAIDWLDQRLNVGDRFEDYRRRGIVALGILVVTAGVIGVALNLAIATTAAGWIIEVVLVSVLLAQKSLVDHVAAVARELVTAGVHAGRQAVSEIVGRDVHVLDGPGVARAAIESGAENFSDAVVAPAFWYLLFGLPGLLIYRAVNTADSMIGHRTPRYLAFGWAAARFDDLLNLIPARLSALLIVATAALAGCDARAAFGAARRDASKHKSPNAGWPEAALAGALGLALGGPRQYGSEGVDGAWLNPTGRPDASPNDIRAAVRLIDGAWALLLMIVALIATIAISIGR